MRFETPENMDKCCNTCRWMKRYINRAPRHKEKREDMDYDG